MRASGWPAVPHWSTLAYRSRRGSDGMILAAFRQGDPTQRGLAAMADTALDEPEYTGLDSVPVPVYVEWMRRNAGHHGARFGSVQDGVIVWE